MKNSLKRLLDSLEVVGISNEEIFDSDVRQKMSNCILLGFVKEEMNYIIPTEFGMFSKEANASVGKAIAEYIVTANKYAKELGLYSFHERLSSLQDPSVQSKSGYDYDEFLGHSPAENFDSAGNLMKTI